LHASVDEMALKTGFSKTIRIYKLSGFASAAGRFEQEQSKNAAAARSRCSILRLKRE